MKSKKISIQGKVAFISGAKRGIGEAIAEELLEKGASKVYIGTRDKASADHLVDKYKERAVPVHLELLDYNSIAEAVSMTKDTEILINNAGVFDTGNFTRGNLLESLKVNLDVNVWGTIRLTDAMLPVLLKKRSSAIVTVSSVVGLVNLPASMTYSMSKAALHSMIQGLRAELKNTNILVSGVYPGAVATDMTKGLEIEMEASKNVAKRVVEGIENGFEDIFPDPMSKEIGKRYLESLKESEKKMAQFI